MHFIDKFCADVSAIVGFPVMVEVKRGEDRDSKVWTRLNPINVLEYIFAVSTSEEYRVISAAKTTSTGMNGYWDGRVCNFFLQYLPGCCGICISYHSGMNGKFMNKGLGKVMRKLREDIARAQGFSTLLSTHTSNNVQQNKIMKKTGAMAVYSFRNARSRKEVIISVADLKNAQTSTVKGAWELRLAAAAAAEKALIAEKKAAGLPQAPEAPAERRAT
jgi:hypothetical protein